MSERKPAVLVVPFSGGSANNLEEQAWRIEYELEDAGMSVDQQHKDRLRRPDPTKCCDIILQIGLGAEKEGLPTLVQLRNLNPGIPIVVISEWEAEEIGEEVRAMADAIFIHRPFGGIKVLIDRIRMAIAENKTAPSE